MLDLSLSQESVGVTALEPRLPQVIHCLASQSGFPLFSNAPRVMLSHITLSDWNFDIELPHKLSSVAH